MREWIIRITIVIGFFMLYGLVGAIEGSPDTVYHTLPGTNVRDWTKSSVVVEHRGDNSSIGYKTIPGTNVRDWTAPGILIERQGNDSTVYETLPGTNIMDWSKPALRFED